MRRPVVSLLAAVVLTAAVVGAGVVVLGRSGSGGSADAGGAGGAGGTAHPQGSPSTAPFTTIPLSAFDSSRAVVARSAFCDRIDPRQVAAALGAAPASARSWANGDKVALAGSGKDVVHEFGCEDVAADGTAARAWVFAPPVSASRAQQLVASASKAKGCTAAVQPAFGAPSVGLVCTGAHDVSASFRGLFGDAWLTCEIDAAAGTDPKALADRAGRWCVGVAVAASS